MGTKGRAFAVGILAATAMSALATLNAGATTGGHFTFEVAHSIVKGFESVPTEHSLEFTSHGLEGGTVCKKTSYGVTVSGTTTTQLELTPSWSECHTTSNGSQLFEIHENGCKLLLTVAPGTTSDTEQTMDITCPQGAVIEVTHPNCTITLPPQAIANSATYVTITQSNKHALTIEMSAKFESQYHGGICVFTGTSHTATLHGELTVVAETTAGAPVNLTAK
jgi:hypothetical protein